MLEAEKRGTEHFWTPAPTLKEYQVRAGRLGRGRKRKKARQREKRGK